MTCPDLEQLERFVTRQSSADSSASVASHVEGCSSCKMRLSEIEENLRLLGDLSPHSFSLSAGKLPETIGPYSVVRLLGEGGMGVVYEAMQAHPRRAVALKVIRGNYAGGWIDEHHVKLFQREVQTLARLKHAHIASIYDAGRTDDGRPFFAMEMVSGVPLTHYAESQKLPVRERLGLFAKVCDAINYAHQRGVVHRDLKPSNILIDADGTPKVLDFGLAKLTDADVTATTITTETGRIQGTLAYMSPEQAAGNPNEIDLRSDVYSLGVILFEFLTGSLPYDVQRVLLPEAIRVIREEPPRKPSTIHKTLRGDLETIVLKALEKERDRRYQFAAELSQDIQRYLRGEAIMARPPSVRYQLRVLARRHKGLLTAVTTVFAVLVLGIAATGIALAREKTQRVRAERETETAKQVTNFLVDLFQINDPSEAKGNTITAREILDQGAKTIAEDLKDQPVVRAKLMETIGRVYQNLGLYQAARPHLETALELRQAHPDDSQLEVAVSMNDLAALLRKMGDYPTAEHLFIEALDIRRTELGNEHIDTCDTLNNLAVLLSNLGKYKEAESLYREVLRVEQKMLSSQHPNTINTMNNLASVLKEQGELDTAEQMFLDVLTARRAIFGDEHVAIASTLNNLAAVLRLKGDFEGAEVMFRDTLAMRRKLLSDEHPEVAMTINNLAVTLRQKGDLAAAEPLYHEAITLRRKIHGDEHPEVATCMNNYAGLLQEKGDYAAAEPMMREALAMRRRLLGEPNPKVADTQDNLGELLRAMGQFTEAETQLREALEIRRAVFGEENRSVAESISNLGVLRFDMGDDAVAESFLRDSLAMRRRLLRDEHPDTARNMVNLARTLRNPGSLDEAKQLNVEALPVLRRTLPAGHRIIKRCLVGLAETLAGLGSFAEAEEAAREAVKIEEMDFTEDRRDKGIAIGALGWVLLSQDSFAEAEPLLLSAYEAIKDRTDVPPPRKRELVERIVELYESWDAAEPGNGHAEKAAEYRDTLTIIEPQTPIAGLENAKP